MIQLDFIRPFEGHNLAQFNLSPEGGATEVTWSMRGANPPMAKVMSLFMDMDRMIGKDFEKGLRQAEGHRRGRPSRPSSWIPPQGEQAETHRGRHAAEDRRHRQDQPDRLFDIGPVRHREAEGGQRAQAAERHDQHAHGHQQRAEDAGDGDGLQVRQAVG